MYITRVLSLLFTYLLLSNAAPLFFRDDPNRDRPALEERRIQKRNEFFNIEFLDISNTEAGVVAMSNNDEVLVARAFRMAIALANAAVGIQPDNPLYSIFFHDVSNYNEVMDNFRRVAALGNPDNENEVTILRANPAPDDPPTGIAVTESNIIRLLPRFFDPNRTPQFQPFVGSNIGINSLMQSQAATMLHELIHLVSPNRMRVVLGRAQNTFGSFGPERPLPFRAISWNSAVRDIDPRMWAVPGNAADAELVRILTGTENGPIAYGLPAVLGLSQLFLGAGASAMNADSYTGFAIAAWVNWAFTNFSPNIPNPNLSNARQISVWRNGPTPQDDPSVSGATEGIERATLGIINGNLEDSWLDLSDSQEESLLNPLEPLPGIGRFLFDASGHYQKDIF